MKINGVVLDLAFLKEISFGIIPSPYASSLSIAPEVFPFLDISVAVVECSLSVVCVRLTKIIDAGTFLPLDFFPVTIVMNLSIGKDAVFALFFEFQGPVVPKFFQRPFLDLSETTVFLCQVSVLIPFFPDADGIAPFAVVFFKSGFAVRMGSVPVAYGEAALIVAFSSFFSVGISADPGAFPLSVFVIAFQDDFSLVGPLPKVPVGEATLIGNFCFLDAVDEPGVFFLDGAVGVNPEGLPLVPARVAFRDFFHGLFRRAAAQKDNCPKKSKKTGRTHHDQSIKKYFLDVSDENSKTIASTLNAKIRTSWVWLVLAVTVGLTVLFYFSQKPQVVAYSGYTKSLSDYLLQEASVMRSVDQIRVGVHVDTAVFQSQMMSMREMARSFSREMDELRKEGSGAPTVDAVARYEREVLGKVSRIRRYAERRSAWFQDYRKNYEDLFTQDPSIQKKVRPLMDSARAGYQVALGAASDGALDSMPDSLKQSLVRLFRENEELSLSWNSFNNGLSMAYTEDLNNFFQMESLNELALKGKIPMAFYFLSLVLLLSTFFFVLYARR